MKNSNLLKLLVNIVIFIGIYITIFLNNYNEVSLYNAILFIFYCILGFLIGYIIRNSLVKNKKFKILNYNPVWLIIILVIVMKDTFNSSIVLKGIQIIILSAIIFISDSDKKSLDINV